MAIERALTMILYPQMVKELKNKLLEEAKEHVIRACCSKLYNWLKVRHHLNLGQIILEVF